MPQRMLDFLEEFRKKEAKPKTFDIYLISVYRTKNVPDELWNLELKYYSAKYCEERKDADEKYLPDILALRNKHFSTSEKKTKEVKTPEVEYDDTFLSGL